MIHAWIEDTIPVDVAKGLAVGVGPMLPIHCARECRGLPRGRFLLLVGPLVAGVLRWVRGVSEADRLGQLVRTPTAPDKRWVGKRRSWSLCRRSSAPPRCAGAASRSGPEGDPLGRRMDSLGTECRIHRRDEGLAC